MAGSQLRPGTRWPAIAKGLGFLALGLFTASWLLLSLFSIRNLILLAVSVWSFLRLGGLIHEATDGRISPALQTGRLWRRLRRLGRSLRRRIR